MKILLFGYTGKLGNAIFSKLKKKINFSFLIPKMQMLKK